MQVISVRMRTADYLKRFPGRYPSTTKKQQPKNMIPESLLYWEDLLRTTGRRTASPQLWETAPQTKRRSVCMWLWWRDDVQINSYLGRKRLRIKRNRCLSEKFLEHFYPWEVVKIGFINFLWKLTNSLLTCCFSFPRGRVPRSWSPSWTPNRVCWRSGTAVGSDFILQNLMPKDVFIVILKEKHQSSCGKEL